MEILEPNSGSVSKFSRRYQSPGVIHAAAFDGEAASRRHKMAG
jgi:hypothetical protein